MTTILPHQQLRKSIIECKQCNLHKVGGPVPFWGKLDARIMILGQNPGEVEIRQGRPFIGPAGQLMRDMLKDVGLNPADIFWANCVSCGTVQNAAPAKLPTLSCKKWRMQQVLICKPEVVVLTGEYALQVFQPHLKIAWQRGRPFEWAAGTMLQGAVNDTGRAITFFATYHPASATFGRNPALRKDIKEDLQAVIEFMKTSLYPSSCVVCRKEGERQEESGIVWCGVHWDKYHTKQESLFQ